jgi:effector-binding domain-containing protein
MPEFEIRSVPRHDTAVVRVSTPTDQISQAVGPAMGAAFAAVGKAGAIPVGPPLCKYLTYSETSVEFETGVPVAAPFPGDGDVRAGEVGGCEAAVGVHVGPYDTIGQTYQKLQAWIEGQGRKPATVMWESYLTDPQQEPDSSKWRTEICWPVE